MRFDKFTLKAQETIQNSQQTAERFGHQQIEPEHFMVVILEEKEGVIPSIIGKIGANQDQYQRLKPRLDIYRLAMPADASQR